ncbi:hypothetical protein QLQ12_34625 [Actinoplanes sp. NEAU-A12]|uniref:Uncharacterized protein n=1 Tax=Actinoplanes sandaracinus TaxID=3045177 RepID=A0ABT6WVI9_9ACTN|nr:hypothetical protein [Actinoplanes sandaracinus]MDI6103762.1 hypothetical protein [Actinoplanes sandaracinus]
MSERDRRLVFIRHPGRHWVGSMLVNLAIPLFVGLPALLLVVTPLVWAVLDFSAAWRTAAGLSGLLLLLGAAVMVLMSRDELRAVRWIEVRPAEEPAGVTIQRIRGADRIPVADLRRVVIVEGFKLGRSVGAEVVFETAAGPVLRCPPGPQPRMTAPALTDWFTGHLAPAGVDVRYETAVVRAYPTIERWYETSQVAELWQVPASEVAGLARRLNVREQTFTPRVNVMYGGVGSHLVYEPDAVHEVVAAVPGARAPEAEPLVE